MFRLVPILALLVACAGLSACDTAGPEGFAEEVVVESYQTAGEPMAPVRLSRTVPLDSAYTFEDLAVRDAEVTVARLGAGGEVAERIPYRPDPDSLGFYRPAAELDGRNVPVVQPLATYRLTARVPEGPTLRATTTVPDTFTVVRVNRDTAVYQSPEQIALTITPSRTPDREQAYYIFTTEALAPTEANLTPLVREFLEDSDDFTLEDARVTSSPILNESGYETNPDGTLTIRLPWIAVAFYGPTRATASVIDDNLYDFIRSQSAQQGGGGFTPGAIPTLLESVDGGTGIFGSRARATRRVVIQRP